MIIKAQYLHGTVRRRSDRHKREGESVIPGEICKRAARLWGLKGPQTRLQKSAEAIVGGGAEGLNNAAESRTDGLEAKR